ncbi:MAG: 8-oxo-dGTP diphosphatase [Verrucomicrobia bacterium]|nr:8-oxo-dGTP diphosphatase [Verrucomicrobiota bacterium]MCH8511850.1 8-oxo-dGTP diphosphatase [Kiritimatiellia bacterium]
MTTYQAHPEFEDIPWHDWRPKDQATLCFVIRDGQILLIEKKRGLGQGKINGPGGRFEPGETALQCAIRETEEELCVTPTGLQNRGLLRFQFKDGYSLEAHIFSATDCMGEAMETEEAVPRWTPIDHIPYDRMWADDILWLPHMLAGRNIQGDFLFDDDAMLGYRLHVAETSTL